MSAPVEVASLRIQAAVPRVSAVALDNLLYLCQGYCLAWLREPLFLNDLEPTADGVRVGAVRGADRHDLPPDLSEAKAGVVDEVISRYGSLEDHQLADVLRDTYPWQEAHHGGWLIAPEVMRDWFLATRPER